APASCHPPRPRLRSTQDSRYGWMRNGGHVTTPAAYPSAATGAEDWCWPPNSSGLGIVFLAPSKPSIGPKFSSRRPFERGGTVPPTRRRHKHHVARPGSWPGKLQMIHSGKRSGRAESGKRVAEPAG